MCGIFGYIGERDATGLLLDGLQRLEYRGYDSAGLSVHDGSRIETVKSEGTIDNLRNAVGSVSGTLGISHTRWATHGEVNEANAHPHVSDDIAIVHNGIIENYEDLKEFLTDRGYAFQSGTDSEVIAHLLNHFYRQSLESAMRKVLPMLDGSFAVAAVKEDERKIVGTRRGSPLVAGRNDDGYFISSDEGSFLTEANEVCYLDEDAIIVLEDDASTLYDPDGVGEPRYETVDADDEAITKRGHESFMHKEIHEQPAIIRNNIADLDIDVASFNRIILTACGTSWHACLIGKYILEEALRVPVEVDYASELRYRDPIVGEDDLVIGVSQSGETADTIGALETVREAGATIFGIVNEERSHIARMVDVAIPISAGKEVGVASTKAFTGQVLAFNRLAGVSDAAKKIPAQMEQLLAQEGEYERIANENLAMENALFMGRGINFPVALEGALKLKEISYVHAEGYPAAEMKHGPIALIDDNMPSVFIANKGPLYAKVVGNMEEVKARGGTLIVLSDDPELESMADYFIQVPSTTPSLSPLLNVIPLQFFAYYVAKLNGKNVDKPRNLAKCVTVE
jgi:glucosamine--fructose-6-phosphate aminotransferase (isomerizing)